nr:MAG TPA: hypothetical protein [Caudoviricetes sp.]
MFFNLFSFFPRTHIIKISISIYNPWKYICSMYITSFL